MIPKHKKVTHLDLLYIGPSLPALVQSFVAKIISVNEHLETVQTDRRYAEKHGNTKDFELAQLRIDQINESKSSVYKEMRSAGICHNTIRYMAVERSKRFKNRKPPTSLVSLHLYEKAMKMDPDDLSFDNWENKGENK